MMIVCNDPNSFSIDFSYGYFLFNILLSNTYRFIYIVF